MTKSFIQIGCTYHIKEDAKSAKIRRRPSSIDPFLRRDDTRRVRARPFKATRERASDGHRRGMFRLSGGSGTRVARDWNSDDVTAARGSLSLSLGHRSRTAHSLATLWTLYLPHRQRELARKLLQEDDSQKKRTLNLHYGLKDSKGNRQGKTLDYFASEERAYDILETTCDGLKEYALGKGENRALQWLQMDGDKQTRQKMLVSFAGEPNQENAEKRGLGGDWKDRWKSEGKKLVQWCQLFLEDQEELLLKLLKEKVVTKDTARDGILVDLMCKEENALQTFERPPPCSDKADSAIDLPIDATTTTTPSTRPNPKSTQRNDL